MSTQAYSSVEQPEIYHGKDGDFKSFPYSAAFIYETKDGTKRDVVCTGIFLSSNWVLTAAHCINNFRSYIDQYGVKILVLNGGDGNIKKPLFTYETLEFHNNPKYSDAHDPDTEFVSHDYGLVKIKNDHHQCFKSNAHFKACFRRLFSYNKIKIPSLEEARSYLTVGTNLTTVGFGLDETDKISWHLKHTELPTIAIDQARNIYRTYLEGRGFPKEEVERYLEIEVHEKFIFTNSGLTSTCYGDSGGPLIFKKKKKVFLFGVASWGTGGEASNCGGMSSFSSLLFDDGWINSIMNR